MKIKSSLFISAVFLLWAGWSGICAAEVSTDASVATDDSGQSKQEMAPKKYDAMNKGPVNSMDHSKSMGSKPMDHSKHGQMMDHSKPQAKSMKMDHSMHGGHGGHHDHNMTLDAEGMVMNSNDSTLPEDCNAISRDYEFTVRAGTDYAKPFAGSIFGMDQHELKVEPCSRIAVTFVNEDEVRHQWMVHKLPKYIYPQGMFHLEAAGGATKTGTFIVPSDNRTYLIHCDIAQHMEKGMKAQLVVGSGSGDLPSIPGVTQAWRPDIYPFGMDDWVAWALAFLGCVGVLYLGRRVLL